MQSPFSTQYPDDSDPEEGVHPGDLDHGQSRPLDPTFGEEHTSPAMQAAGVALLAHSDFGPRRVALLRRQGAVCLPRVLVHPGESTLEAAQRAVRDQVHSDLRCGDWQHLSEVLVEVSGQPVNTDYWCASASDSDLPDEADGFWLPLALASEQLAFPEEREVLLALDDPLIQSPPAPAPPPMDEGTEFPPITPGSPPKKRWAFDPHRSRLAETIAAARSHVESAGSRGDWRASALVHLSHAEGSLQSGQVEAAQESLTHAWRLDLESRSVGERRLMTQLLRGEVREHTAGWLRDALLTALQESPDAGTMALVRSEIEKQNRLASQRRIQNNQGRLTQLIIAVPVCIALLVGSTANWLDGGMPATGDIMPATLSFGLLGGLAWSLTRGQSKSFSGALAPLAIGAGGALFGLLLSKSGIVTIGQDSVPLMLCLAVLWGVAAAALVDLKRSRG